LTSIPKEILFGTNDLPFPELMAMARFKEMVIEHPYGEGSPTYNA